jgi:hypothetical protein
MILDRDSKFDADVITFQADEYPIALAKWNAERWVGSCRREIRDHVIALDERHQLRLMRGYLSGIPPS